MDKKKVFDTLGIDTTKDMNIIKKAYRTKLVQVNPEDDPVGFRLLREAYEEAVRLSNIEEEEPLDTPIIKWIKEVENVYNKLSTRRDITCWRELFNAEICKDFDTSNEAKEALLAFLMDNFRLPAEVWQLIEDEFQLVESREELYEKFPVDFINFVTQEPERTGWIDFTLFHGADEADIDEFISLYLSLRRINDSEEYDGLEELFDKLEQINLWHPYLEVEKIRYFVAHKQLERAEEIIEDVRLKKCTDIYVKYYIAEFYLACEDLENAYKECKDILEVNPEHFGAKVLLCDYYIKKEQYKEAKEGYLKLLEIDIYNEYLSKGLEKCNDVLIKSMEEQLEREPDNKELVIELGWCFYQNRLFNECVNLVSNLEIDDEIYYDYYNLMSRTYMEIGEYEKAFPCVERWLEEILKVEDDGTEKAKRKLARLGLAYYFMSKCHYRFDVGEGDKKDFSKCIEFIDLAINVEENISSRLIYLASKAQALLEVQEDKKCIDVCDEILRVDNGYYPAYLMRQEAYFNLKMYQEVIDDYYSAIEIYPINARPYIFVVKAYQIYNQWDDALSVIKRAKEAGVESNELLFLELKNKRLVAETNEERKETAEQLDKLYLDIEKEPGDLEEVEYLLYEQALCYYDMQENESALKIIEKKLELKKDFESFMLKADILYDLKKYKEDIELYKELLKENPEKVNLYYRMGLCYSELGKPREKDALDCYLKVVEEYPEHPYVNCELMEIFQKRYQQSYELEDYNQAVKYGKQQIENNPSCYYYTNLGLVYLDAYDMDNAIKAFNEASKCNDGDVYPYNNTGYAHKVLGNFEKALEFYKLAIERIKNEDVLPYRNLAVCYRSMGLYEKAIETYETIAEKGDNLVFINKKILEVYKQMKAWDKAIEQAKKILQLDKEWQMDYFLECADIYAYSGNEVAPLKIYKHAIKKFPKKSEPYIRMGNYMLWVIENKKKALRYYKKAYKVAKKFDLDSQEDSLRYIVKALQQLGKEKKGIPYVEKIENLYDNMYGSVEASLNNLEYRKVRLYRIALWNYNIGQYEKTQDYMKLMKETLNCTHCTYCTCYELLELDAMICELKKDYVGALEKYQKALDIAPDNIDYYTKIKELKEKA